MDQAPSQISHPRSALEDLATSDILLRTTSCMNPYDVKRPEDVRSSIGVQSRQVVDQSKADFRVLDFV